MNRRTMANRTNSGSVFLPPVSMPRDELASDSPPRLPRHLMEAHSDPPVHLASDAWPFTTALLAGRVLNKSVWRGNATGEVGRQMWNFAGGRKRS